MSISLGGLLGIVFIVLKLVGVISWSWLWVLAPFWVSMIIDVIWIIIVILFKVIAELLKWR